MPWPAASCSAEAVETLSTPRPSVRTRPSSTEPSRPEKSRKGLSAFEDSTPTGALERRSASMATPFQTKLTG